MSEVSLGILDLGIVAPGRHVTDVMAETLALAQHADQLGYGRYWLAEHHESHFAWTSPEVVLPAVAALTQNMRVGTAAILLCLYSPLNVAEKFRTLELLFPGRIDAGVCAGVLEDAVALGALKQKPGISQQDAAADYAERLVALSDYLEGRFPADHRFGRGATPLAPTQPQLWYMGGGRGNAVLGARYGAAFSYSLFHRGSAQDPSVIRQYRDGMADLQPNLPARWNVALTCICGERADEVAAHRRQVEEWLRNDARINVSGTPEQCREQILEIAARHDSQEVICHLVWADRERRLASAEMLAEVLGLSRPQRGK